MRILLVVAALALLSSCPAAPPRAHAQRIANRADLIGGPRALGEIGDWLLENDKARFIIQDEGFSRGFGVFGGALLDADLVRPEDGRGDSTGGTGRDNFGEMFPSFFLEALNPTAVRDPTDPNKLLPAISVESDGSDGKDAVLLVRSVGDDFLAITQNLNQTLIGDSRLSPSFNFETRYILHPGAQYLEIDSKVTDVARDPVQFPKNLAGNDIPTPFGDVVLFGAGNKVFLPHEAGFDLRFRLEDVYQANNIPLPAFPGLVAEFIASASKDVSYGVMTFPFDAPPPATGPQPARNFALANKAAFEGAGQTVTDHSLHVPFIASAFTGVFQVLPPDRMVQGDSFHIRRAFIVGDGDVASISDVVLDILKAPTGLLQGRVQERQRPLFVENASVMITDASGAKVTQAAAHKDGFFDAKLRPGHYQLSVVVPGEDPSAPVGIDIVAGKTDFETLFVDSPAELVVTVVEENVGRVPAKATLVGTSKAEDAGKEPRKFLFDLSVGEPFLYTDFIPDVAGDENTRRYIETFLAAADGVIHLRGRPGTYSLVVSRGPEYERVEIPGVKLEPGVTKSLTATLTRVVDTTGYVSADFHLHSQFSLDSSAKVEDRITEYAAENLEYAVSTDHNFIVDYQPVLQKLGIDKFINTAIGLELTTIDRGHFQGYPLTRQNGSLVDVNKDGSFSQETIASRTYGSFEWALRTPDQIFKDMRKLGRPKTDVIVQVNHPRDSILGYFDQYGLSAENDDAHFLKPEGIANALLTPDGQRHPEFDPAVFSFDFDALEVFNGKRYDFLHTFRVPTNAPALPAGVTAAGDPATARLDPVSCCEVHVGDIVRDTAKRDCPVGASDCLCDAAVFALQITNQVCGRTGDIAFPGVVEDWFKLLSTGKHVVGTANSDSHDPATCEPGTPRTYVGVGTDEPSQVTPENVVDAFHKGDVIMTNGPFVRATATGDGDPVGLGGTVRVVGGELAVTVSVDSASWVVPNVARVYVNGDLKDEKPLAGPGKQTITFNLLGINTDGFLVVEVAGDVSMFPSVYPNELPPLQFTDVIGALGSTFGLGGNADKLKPALTSVATPYALTNPIWIDGDGQPGVTPAHALPNPAASTHGDRPRIASVMKHVDVPWADTEDEAAIKAWLEIPLRKRVALSRLPRWLWPSDDPRDVRRVLLQFVAHAD